MNDDCENFDAYLADDLPADAAEAFAAHLPECDECREAIDEQQWIDDLLQSPVRLALEPAPPQLAAAMRVAVTKREGRQKRLVAIALATAATIFVAIGWIQLNRQAGNRIVDGASTAGVATGNHPRSQARPRATFVASSNEIAVPVASHHPDVTIVRVYPAFQPRAESQTAAIEPEAAKETSWHTFSNGG